MLVFQAPRVPQKRASTHQCLAIDPRKSIVREALSIVERHKRRRGKIAVRELL